MGVSSIPFVGVKFFKKTWHHHISASASSTLFQGPELFCAFPVFRLEQIATTCRVVFQHAGIKCKGNIKR
jgi:hypothetical protein